jgi:hypothetical protein
VVRDRILKQDKGDSGLETLEVACDLTLQTGIIATAVVLNEMRRLTETSRPKALENLALSIPTLQLEPQADCQRYDSLRELQHEQ